MTWSNHERVAWLRTYFRLQETGEEYYFSNQNGYRRCLEEAKAGVPRAEATWAMYMEERMKG